MTRRIMSPMARRSEMRRKMADKRKLRKMHSNDSAFEIDAASCEKWIIYQVEYSGRSVWDFSVFGSVRFVTFGFRFGSVFQKSKLSVSVRFGFSIFRSVFGSVFGFPIFQKLILTLSKKIWKENLQFSSLAWKISDKGQFSYKILKLLA